MSHKNRMALILKVLKIPGGGIFAVLLILTASYGLFVLAEAAVCTRIELSDAETGRKIISALLRDGEEIVMNWRNSLFGLDVTEVFHARSGVLILDSVTFADPRGLPPPIVAPADVDDLYQTGGPFTARGLGKPFSRIVCRVGEIGNPGIKIHDRTVSLKQEVGFGGGVQIEATSPTWFEVIRDHTAAWFSM